MRADDEPDTRPTNGEEGSTLWLTTTKRRTSRTLLPKASRASASPATPISKHVFPTAKSAGQSGKKVSFTKLQLDTVVQEAVKNTVQETVAALAKNGWQKP